jgi:hypothetical protein
MLLCTGLTVERGKSRENLRPLRDGRFLSIIKLDQAFEDVGQAFQCAFECGLADSLVGLGEVGMENSPCRGFEPASVFDFSGIAAAADVSEAGEHVRQVNGGDELGCFGRIFGAVMVPRDFDEHLGEIVLVEINCAEFGVIDAEDAAFAFEQIGFFERFIEIDSAEMIGKCGGEDDFTHVVDKAGDVIGFVFVAVGWAGEFASENGSGDAVLPEFAPGEEGVAGEFVKIFNDGRDDSELADLADAKVKDGFFDAVDRRGEAVIDGVDESQEAGGQARVATDDFRNLGGETVVGVEEFFEGRFNAAQRGETRALFDFGNNRGLVTRFDLWQVGADVHFQRIIGWEQGEL